MSDPDKSLARSYGAFDEGSPAYPRRAAFVVGTDGKITHAWQKVSAADFPQEVLDLLSAKKGGSAG